MNASGADSSAPAGHAIMFWVLTTLAMAVFAPCVLVPIWLETEEVIEHERSAAALVAGLQRQVDRNDARARALLADPLVNERIIRRELNFRPDGEQVVRWRSAELVGLDLDLPEPSPDAAIEPSDHHPAWMTPLGRWLPPWPWRKLFGESPNRSLLLVLAGGLLVSAFVLYGPASSHPSRRAERASFTRS